MRAGCERRLDDPIWVLREGSRHAGAAGARLLAVVRKIGFLALEGRQAGVVGVLGWQGEFGVTLGNAGGQGCDLLRLRVDQRDQVIAREGKERCVVHAWP
jgi:hypothetical protein